MKVNIPFSLKHDVLSPSPKVWYIFIYIYIYLPLLDFHGKLVGKFIPFPKAVFPGFRSKRGGLSFREMQHVMASSRPVAFFDFEAMERARPRYQALFAEEGDAMRDAKCKEEALALL